MIEDQSAFQPQSIVGDRAGHPHWTVASDGTLDLRCPECGYRLVGLTEARCLDCGQRYTLDERLARQQFTTLPPGKPARLTPGHGTRVNVTLNGM